MSFVNNSRMSVYSTASASAPRGGPQPTQTTTTTLLNTLNSAYKNGRSYQLEASTSLVVNTWVNSKSIIDDRIGGTVDLELGRKAWEHARRRAEDGCIVLSYVPRTHATFCRLLTPTAPFTIRAPRYSRPLFQAFRCRFRPTSTLPSKPSRPLPTASLLITLLHPVTRLWHPSLLSTSPVP